MDYFSSHFYNCLDDEDKYFVKKINDWIEKSEQSYILKYSDFLDSSKIKICKELFSFKSYNNYKLFGGYTNAERVMLCIYSEYCTVKDTDFPCVALEFDFRKCDKLSHRDFLGCLMNLQIKREMIGDIIINDGKAIVFVSEKISQFTLQNVSKVGSVGVNLNIATSDLNDLKSDVKYLDISGTISSYRLDCIVSFVTKLSREKSSAIVKSGSVKVNYNTVENVSSILNSGDIFSIKGYGKFLIGESTGMTKKGRYNIVIKKYV